MHRINPFDNPLTPATRGRDMDLDPFTKPTFAHPSSVQANENYDLKKKLGALTTKVEELEARLSKAEAYIKSLLGER